MTTEEAKEKVKHYLNNRLKECEANIQRLKKKYRTVKIFFGTTMIITITTSTVIAGLSSTVVPPLGITILGIIGTLSGALSIKFNLKKQKSRLQDAIRESNTIKNKLEYVIMCNGDAADLSTFVKELNKV